MQDEMPPFVLISGGPPAFGPYPQTATLS